MKVKILKITTILLIFTGSFSCEKDNENSQNDVLINKSDINIRMIETLSNTKRTLRFYCLTKEIYPCINYSIGTIINKTTDKIDISFGDVIKYDGCFTAIGPATCDIDLDALSNGIYQLDINVNQKKNSGLLIVSDESYIVKLTENEQIKFINSPLMRIPPNTIWGTIGYHENSTSALVQNFINSLQQLGAVSKRYKQGTYGEYEIGSNGQIKQQGEDSGYHFAVSFIFYYSGNTSSLEGLVKYYGNHYGESLLYIILYTDKGEVYRSWMH
ncbi:MAG: hypothetical protein LBT27_04370 [Prevotellaceae bacterium]|jgi:hypothetical protein|nr:hypothetical protein [Prevotellaceae bacterium]